MSPLITFEPTEKIKFNIEVMPLKVTSMEKMFNLIVSTIPER
jgi:hypothetical protein